MEYKKVGFVTLLLTGTSLLTMLISLSVDFLSFSKVYLSLYNRIPEKEHIFLIAVLNAIVYLLGILIATVFGTGNLFNLRWFEVSLFIQSLSWFFVSLGNPFYILTLIFNYPLSAIFAIYFFVAILWALATEYKISKLLRILPDNIDLPSSILSIFISILIKNLLLLLI